MYVGRLPDGLRTICLSVSCLQVRQITIDLNFSPGLYHPHARAMPYTTNSVGDPVTLQDLNGNLLLPNLCTLVERTTSEEEDYDVYKVQTLFRFSFYGAFSPSRVSLAYSPRAERMVHQNFLRFPTTLLYATSHLSVRDFVDLGELFPLLQLPPPHFERNNETTRFNASTNRSASPYLAPAISYSVTTLVCFSEEFHFYGNDLFPGYLSTSLEMVFEQFPNLRRLHLPRIKALRIYDQDDYINAVKSLGNHADARVRRLKVHLDQEIDNT